MGHFIFVRHGQSQANADKVLADATPPLTEVGTQQAHQTGRDLQGFGLRTIICSPYLRARQTAEIIADELGLDVSQITTMADLRERGLGVLEAKPREHEGTWYFTVDQVQGGESRQELLDRMSHCLNLIASLSAEGPLLVVGHAISGFYLMQAAKGLALPDFPPASQMSNAGYVEVDY